ncbi:uncharacterized protein PV09_04787 [Verruconis gallopava]|uniref:Endoplasmic reticulum lectin n=1 Tax=Verruconis gallopava TaxID=253628 RepID=A0A0D2ABP3_9PEZI|nr:uncharacterized protein PV09_04787 [Verruconis gallopava]KIW03950.1 hypothetical protein PV09_04787 [Verruconis gallopava]
MKHFWALPAFLRLAIASQHQFNVFDDLLAFPQYEVVIADGVMSEQDASTALEAMALRKHGAAHAERNPSADASLSRIHGEQREAEGRPVPSQPNDQILSYEDMMLNDRRYLCSIPRIPDAEAAKNKSKISPEDEEKELARATSRGWGLLKSMEGHCLYFYSGWWSYSFCYGQGVRQFHQLPPGKGVPIYPPVEDKSVDAYVLGKYGDAEGGKSTHADGAEEAKGRSSSRSGSSDKGLAQLETKGETRYLVQKLGGGTTCDLTGKERRVEVQFRCQPNQADKIALIKETTTCQYLMIIDTPRLCNDVAFLPPQESKPHAIECTPVLPAASIPSYLAAKESQTVSEDERLAKQIEEEINDAINLLETGEIPMRRQIVGDVEIGAHKLVPPGKKIERGVIVGGGKEKHIATIAKSGGWVAAEEQLKKVGVTSRQDLDEIKKKVENAANGNSWRLEVVETPRGKELRGIIEAGGNDDDLQKGDGGSGEERNDAQGTEGGQEDGSEETYKEEL